MACCPTAPVYAWHMPDSTVPKVREQIAMSPADKTPCQTVPTAESDSPAHALVLQAHELRDLNWQIPNSFLLIPLGYECCVNLQQRRNAVLINMRIFKDQCA